MDWPLGYFISFRTYGTWLHGDGRGSVDARHYQYDTPFVVADAPREKAMRERMRDEPFVLDAQSAQIVERTVTEVCEHRRWLLRIVQARTNHVHTVVTAMIAPERVMNDFKAWATRRLRENGYCVAGQKVWSEHGSTPYLWTDEQLEAAIKYVRDGQGGPLKLP